MAPSIGSKIDHFAFQLDKLSDLLAAHSSSHKKLNSYNRFDAANFTPVKKLKKRTFENFGKFGAPNYAKIDPFRFF